MVHVGDEVEKKLIAAADQIMAHADEFLKAGNAFLGQKQHLNDAIVVREQLLPIKTELDRLNKMIPDKKKSLKYKQYSDKIQEFVNNVDDAIRTNKDAA